MAKVQFARIPQIQSKLAELNGRSERAGLSARLELVIRATSVETSPDGRFAAHVADVELIGEAPVVAGWAFVARCDAVNGAVIITRPPSARLAEIELTRFYESPLRCEHCSAKRRRTVTYLLADVSALVEGCVEIKQVGSSCLELYLGTCPEAALRLLAEIDQVQRDLGSGEWLSSRGSCVPLRDFVACAVASVRTCGYRKTTSDNSTREDAHYLMYPPRLPIADWTERQPTAEDYAQADLMLAWLAEQTDGSDYMHNLRTACANAWVDTRFTGLVASLPQAYSKDRGLVTAKEPPAPIPPKEYYGVPKQRYTAELTVTAVIMYVSEEWGSGRLVKFRCGNSDLLWFSTSCRQTWEIGKTYMARFTVKAHSPDKRTAEPTTIISRVTLT